MTKVKQVNLGVDWKSYRPQLTQSTADVFMAVHHAEENQFATSRHDGFFVCAYCRCLNSIGRTTCEHCGAPREA